MQRERSIRLLGCPAAILLRGDGAGVFSACVGIDCSVARPAPFDEARHVNVDAHGWHALRRQLGLLAADPRHELGVGVMKRVAVGHHGPPTGVSAAAEGWPWRLGSSDPGRSFQGCFHAFSFARVQPVTQAVFR